jgi:peptidoglycan/LPS O-acetylase OafA/YrhL
MNRWLIWLMAAGLALAPFAVLAQATDTGTTTPLDQMSDYALWAIVSGFIGVWVAAAINQEHWRSTTKFAVFFAWCVLASAVDAYLKRQLDLHNWVRAMLFVFAAGQATYASSKGAVKQFETTTTAR